MPKTQVRHAYSLPLFHFHFPRVSTQTTLTWLVKGKWCGAGGKRCWKLGLVRSKGACSSRGGLRQASPALLPPMPAMPRLLSSIKVSSRPMLLLRRAASISSFCWRKHILVSPYGNHLQRSYCHSKQKCKRKIIKYWKQIEFTLFFSSKERKTKQKNYIDL